MKKVISFSLYGSKATYIIGMKENIKLAKQHFSDWEVRIYHNNTVPENYINEYKELHAICILCENIGENKLNWEGMFWRWYPLDDKNVDIWLSRDADSRLSAREAKIVDEWINSGKTLHSIRDHRCHFNYIMGGMFGINNKLFHEKYKFKTVSQIIKELSVYYKERPYNVDQIFLNDKLWNLLKNDMMAHISKDGRRVYSSDILIPSVPDFIGKQYTLNDDLIVEKANVKSVNPEINIIFKIKSKYKELYLDFIDGKIKLNIFTQEKSQLWKLDENNRLINLLNNKFLDIDNNCDLILSENNKNTWVFKQGGFLINQQNNMAIDFKGGINHKRKEVWLFKINYTEAQQWDTVIETSNNINYNKDIECIDNKTNISEYFDQIYIIHLNELLDRKKLIIEQIQKYIGEKNNVTIIDAINKNTIDKNALIKNELIAYPGNSNCKNIRINDKPEPLPSPNGYKCWCNNRGHNDLVNYNGRIACALGHFLVYEDIVKNSFQKCLILEDDFIFSKEINNVFNNIVNDIPDNWELLYFANSRKIRHNHPNINSSFVFCGFNGGMCSDTGCYAINNKAANELFTNIFPLKSAADGYLCSIVDRRFKLKNTYICRQNFGLSTLLKSANDHNKIEEYSQDEIKKYNIILKSMVNKYDKNNINDIINKYSLFSCVPSNLNNTDLNNDILALVLISCEKYHIFSELCFYLIEKNIIKIWKSPVYYSNTYSRLKGNISNIIIDNVEETNFVARLNKTLLQIPNKYIFLVQEDHWFVEEYIEKHSLNKILKVMENYNIDALKLDKYGNINSDNDIIYQDNDITIAWAGNCNWPIMHHDTIYNREYLISNLEEVNKNNKNNAGEHEWYYQKSDYKFNIKQKHNDKRSVRIAYVKKINHIGKLVRTHGETGAILKGKLSHYAFDYLNNNNHLLVVKNLLKNLKKSDFTNFYNINQQ